MLGTPIEQVMKHTAQNALGSLLTAVTQGTRRIARLAGIKTNPALTGHCLDQSFLFRTSRGFSC